MRLFKKKIVEKVVKKITKKYECKECNYRTDHKARLLAHIQKEHKNG